MPHPDSHYAVLHDWEQRHLEPPAHGRYCLACGYLVWHDEGERCPEELCERCEQKNRRCRCEEEEMPVEEPAVTPVAVASERRCTGCGAWRCICLTD